MPVGRGRHPDGFPEQGPGLVVGAAQDVDQPVLDDQFGGLGR
ncbi:hypothetical protein [Kitasatospora fiedleri]